MSWQRLSDSPRPASAENRSYSGGRERPNKSMRLTIAFGTRNLSASR
jgi:hypothetical protein